MSFRIDLSDRCIVQPASAPSAMHAFSSQYIDLCLLACLLACLLSMCLNYPGEVQERSSVISAFVSHTSPYRLFCSMLPEEVPWLQSS